MGMPQRPRAHQLETESERALERILPSSWVLRDMAGDYGIDKELEIFDGTDATGELMKIQLKGTDNAPKKRAGYSVKIDAEKLSYWRRLDIPVLVVLYAAKEGSLYARWAQSYDPYYSRKDGGKSVTFNFLPKDRCSPHIFPDKVRRELNVLRELHRGAGPVWVNVTINAAELGGVRADVLTRLRMAFMQNDDVLNLAESSTANAELVLTRDQIKVAMVGNVTSATLHLDAKANSSQQSATTVCANAMIAVALFLLRIGRTEAAARIILRNIPDSDISESPQVLDEFFRDLIGRGLLAEGWQLIRSAYTKSDLTRLTVAQFWLSQVIMSTGLGKIRRETREDIISVVQQRAEVAHSRGHDGAAASFYYSTGHVLEAARERKRALKAFERAAELNPSYLGRGYYLREVAGLLVDEGDLKTAAEMYDRAVKAGGAPEAEFLRANCWMLQGEYRKAASYEFDSSIMPVFYRAGARLQALTGKHIYATVQLERQDRKPVSAEINSGLNEDGSIDEIVEVMREYDALDPRLWFAAALAQQDDDKAFRSMVVAAEVARDFADPWVIAMVLARELRLDRETEYDICRNAFKYCSSGDIAAAIDRAESSSLDVSGVRDIVTDYSKTPPPRQARVIRLVNDDGSYDVFDVEDEEDRLRLGAVKFLTQLSPGEIERLAHNFQTGKA